MTPVSSLPSCPPSPGAPVLRRDVSQVVRSACLHGFHLSPNPTLATSDLCSSALTGPLLRSWFPALLFLFILSPTASEAFLQHTGSFHSSGHPLPLSPTAFSINSKVLLETHRALSWSSPCPSSQPRRLPVSILPFPLHVAASLSLPGPWRVLSALPPSSLPPAPSLGQLLLIFQSQLRCHVLKEAFLNTPV